MTSPLDLQRRAQAWDAHFAKHPGCGYSSVISAKGGVGHPRQPERSKPRIKGAAVRLQVAGLNSAQGSGITDLLSVDSAQTAIWREKLATRRDHVVNVSERVMSALPALPLQGAGTLKESRLTPGNGTSCLMVEGQVHDTYINNQNATYAGLQSK